MNEASTTYYVTDISENLAQVTAEIDRDGSEKAFYTRGDELLSIERKDGIRYYIYDGHGSTRLLTEYSAAAGIQSKLNSIQHLNSMRNIIKWANAVCTVYDMAAEIRETILGGGTVEDLMGAVLKGVAVGFMCEGMCRTSLGIVLKPVMAIFGLENQVDQIQEAAERGYPAETALRLVQLGCMLTGITSQCFTGDTPVLTEDGLRSIDEIQAGDYVWSENV